MFTWLGPGKRRLIVTAVRNCSLSSQRRRSTTMRCVHADKPPPKLDSEICRKHDASAGSVTGVGRSAAGRPSGLTCPTAPALESLMQEVRVVRQLALVVL